MSQGEQIQVKLVACRFKITLLMFRHVGLNSMASYERLMPIKSISHWFQLVVDGRSSIVTFTIEGAGLIPDGNAITPRVFYDDPNNV